MRNRKKKRRLIYVGFTLALVLLLIGGSYFVYAAMTAQDQKANDFQVGQVETKLLEDFTDITEIETGKDVKKEVLIENTGTIKQFIRVMVLPEVRAPIAGDTNKQVLPLVIGKDLLLENMAITDWKDGGDGYYYYIKEAVEPKKTTSKLFESIKLSDSLAKQYDKTTFSIYLKVETVNCAEFAYRDAWWQGNIPTDQPLKAVDDALRTKVENSI
ncbi:hypothetical protein [Enterococcus sp. AZ072]|uniref:hypothetical protein n=1 Tax=unclassified Enterococcus TaxID=2608891 RepID=UPI003D274BC6